MTLYFSKCNISLFTAGYRILTGDCLILYLTDKTQMQHLWKKKPCSVFSEIVWSAFIYNQMHITDVDVYTCIDRFVFSMCTHTHFKS